MTSSSSLDPPAAARLAPPAGTARWSVQLLGAFSATDLARGTTLTRLRTRAMTLLLARLALAPGRMHPREELIELLWPGAAPAVGRNRLREALSALRAVLEPPGQPRLLEADRQGLRVLDAAIDSDVHRFERALREGQRTLARELYRGELLPGHYDDWIVEQRRRLEALLAEDTPAWPAAPAASATQVPLTSADPLPAYLTRYFDAGGQLARLQAEVCAQRLVTLLGPGGCGKTRLAVELARTLHRAAAPFDAVLFVPLAACHDLPAVHDALRTALGLRPSPQPLPQAMAQALNGRRALIVLDNVEHLLPPLAELPPALLAAMPGLHLLLTSRRVLAIDGEREFALAALPLPEPDAELDAVVRSPAGALFIDRAGASRRGFRVAASEAAPLAALVRALGGLPLAIELAAARVRSLGLAELAERLAGTAAPGQSPRLALLARPGARAAHDPRQASMQAVIEWSWRQLPPPLQQLLRALTVFEGGFDAGAAQEVAAGAGDMAGDVAVALDELVQHSLLAVQPQRDGPVSLALSEPVREFAQALSNPAERLQWRQRHRHWCLQWARSLGSTPALQAVQAQMPNLVAALDSALADGSPGQALELAVALRTALNNVPLPARGLGLLQAAVQADGGHPARAEVLTMLGLIGWEQGRAEQALRDAEAGLALSEPGSVQQARALHALASVRWRVSRSEEGLDELLTAALRLAEQHGQAGIQASVHALRAFIASTAHGDHARAEALHQRAVQLWQHLGNLHAVNGGHYNLAVCALNRGDAHECLARLQPVCRVAGAHDDRTQLSQALNLRGNALTRLRDWPAALAAYLESAELAWAAHAAVEWMYALWNAPAALARLRQAEAAMRLMAFAASHWQRHFGALAAADLRDQRRIERFARVLIGPARTQACADEGRTLTPGAAMQLLRGQR